MEIPVQRTQTKMIFGEIHSRIEFQHFAKSGMLRFEISAGDEVVEEMEAQVNECVESILWKLDLK